MITWREIPEFDGKYIISSDGDIKDTITDRDRRYYITYNGYRRITLYYGDKVKSFLIHVLMRDIFGDHEFKDKTREKVNVKV